MTVSRKGVGSKTLSVRIDNRLRECAKLLKGLGYKSESVSSKEFYEYLTWKAYLDDAVAIPNADLSNDYFVVHELVEISELKKMDIPIDKDTVVKHFICAVFEAHYVATEYELNYAVSKRDFDWVKRRLKDVRYWLEDDHIPKHMINRFEEIITRFEAEPIEIKQRSKTARL